MLVLDSASQEIYFQKIQELIQDDDKIVTVSSLASDLGVSVQNSRNLISKFIEDQRKLKPDELAVTYVVSGTLKENGRKGVFMVKEDNLKEKINLFEADPCQVIYSVQKNKNVDFNIIALVDMFNSTKIRETALHGSIVSKNCIKRTLKFKKLPSPPPLTVKGKSSLFAPKAKASVSAEKPPSPPKTEQKGKATGGIADLFKAAASKPKSENGSASVKPKKPAAKLGGLAGFLNNGASKSPKGNKKNNSENVKNNLKTEHSSSNSESQASIKEEEILDVIDVDFDEEPVQIKEESKATKKDSKSKISERKNGQEKPKKTNKRQRDKSRELPSKKRKRIIERNSSDSDDMFEKDDDDDVIEKSDEEPERIPSPVVQKPVVPKNKRRKAVTKNYEDEEGFIVTKTEYVYETASEDENSEPVPVKQEKREEKPAVKSKAPDKKKPLKNQATLMSFFTKK